MSKRASSSSQAPAGRRTLAYVRVSTDAQTLERQEYVVAQWAALAGVTIDAWLKDEGISGRASAVKGAAAARGLDLAYYRALCGREYLAAEGNLIERPGFLGLLQAVDEGQYGRLVIADLTRLSRDAIELLILLRLLTYLGCELVVVSGGAGAIDTTSAQGYLLYAIQAVMAEMEPRLTAGRTVDSLAAKRASGMTLGRPPAGWRRPVWDRQRETQPPCVPDEKTWPMVKLAAAWRAAGLTLAEVAAECRAAGWRCANAGVARDWCRAYALAGTPGYHATAAEKVLPEVPEPAQLGQAVTDKR